MHTPEPRQPGVSVREAAIHFETSESDIRRRIKRGELHAESLHRPGGTLLRVLLDAPGAAPDGAGSIESPPTPDPRQGAPALTEGLLEILAADREVIRTQSETIAELSMRAGRAEAASEAASARANALQVEVDRLRARRWWHLW
jgi:hypothetical protein